MKKGRASADTFQIGDPVLIQCNLIKRWSKKGKISNSRIAEDGSTQSFLILTEDGREILRNKKFLKHQSGRLLRFADMAVTGVNADSGPTSPGSSA